MSLAYKIPSLLMAPIFTVLALGLFLSPETAPAASAPKAAGTMSASPSFIPGSAQQSVVGMPPPSQVPVQGSAETSP
ncbi:MAG: hypothetical protein NTW71_14860, partial [Deltaproteobacteria bacterium]|nr:hypothetical protein [Deltaproteobacteria bacterium]